MASEHPVLEYRVPDAGARVTFSRMACAGAVFSLLGFPICFSLVVDTLDRFVDLFVPSAAYYWVSLSYFGLSATLSTLGVACGAGAVHAIRMPGGRCRGMVVAVLDIVVGLLGILLLLGLYTAQ